MADAHARRGGKPERFVQGVSVEDPLVVLIEQVYRLIAAGHRDAWDYSLDQVYVAAAIEVKREAEKFRMMAIAGRISQADKKGWEKSMKAISDGDAS